MRTQRIEYSPSRIRSSIKPMNPTSVGGRARSDRCIAEEVARIRELLLETVSP